MTKTTQEITKGGYCCCGDYPASEVFCQYIQYFAGRNMVIIHKQEHYLDKDANLVILDHPHECAALAGVWGGENRRIDIFSFSIFLHWFRIWGYMVYQTHKNKRKEMEQDEIQKMCCCWNFGTVPGGGRSSERPGKQSAGPGAAYPASVNGVNIYVSKMGNTGETVPQTIGNSARKAGTSVETGTRCRRETKSRPPDRSYVHKKWPEHMLSGSGIVLSQCREDAERGLRRRPGLMRNSIMPLWRQTRARHTAALEYPFRRGPLRDTRGTREEEPLAASRLQMM